jgi:16S rRNA (cytidine1402-2'-O)-methyltransferase
MSAFFVVATPIGNLEDITFRAIQTLKEVDIILAEDTRHSQKLLIHYQIKTKLQSLHEHNEREKTDSIIEQLKNGTSFALISDAGTPLISDPGFLLVSQLKKESINVIPIPGVSAVITAMSASGLASNSFSFIGFLPSKSQQRLNTLKSLIQETKTVILYESPKRVLALLKDISIVFGEQKQICLAKELTKTFETILTMEVSEIIKWLEEDIKRQKGEFVVLISASEKTTNNEELIHILKSLLTTMSPSDAAKMAKKITGITKKDCYNLALKL